MSLKTTSEKLKTLILINVKIMSRRVNCMQTKN